jgi:tetratricopeptide (TPR) repeat protein
MNVKGAIFFLLAGAMSAAGPTTEAWKAITDYRADQALREFGEATGNTAEARNARLGRAVALLAKQPVTAGQVDDARRICTELANSGSDEPALAGRFLLARIAQHHQEVPDPTEAARQFRQLIAEHENSIWAQSALSRLALLQLYVLDPSQPPANAVAESEKLLDLAHVPEVKGELHIALAEAIFFFHLPDQQALPHLLAAEPLGGYDRVGRADLLLQIAELSRLAGKKEQAGKYYRLFLKENPRDSANYNARRHLADMEGTPILPPP